MIHGYQGCSFCVIYYIHHTYSNTLRIRKADKVGNAIMQVAGRYVQQAGRYVQQANSRRVWRHSPPPSFPGKFNVPEN